MQNVRKSGCGLAHANRLPYRIRNYLPFKRLDVPTPPWQDAPKTSSLDNNGSRATCALVVGYGGNFTGAIRNSSIPRSLSNFVSISQHPTWLIPVLAVLLRMSLEVLPVWTSEPGSMANETAIMRWPRIVQDIVKDVTETCSQLSSQDEKSEGQMICRDLELLHKEITTNERLRYVSLPNQRNHASAGS